MKEKFRFAFRWLSFRSITKFTNFNEVIAFILPTTGFYYDIVPKIMDFPNPILLTIVAMIFITLFLFNLYKRYSDHEKSIAEVLETGYFTNFIEKAAFYFKHKRDDDSNVVINFKDKSSVTLKTNAIKICVLLPLSKSSLNEIISEIDRVAKPASIDNGPWVYAEHDIEDNKITIYECPRTLKTICKYIDSSENEYSEEQSKRLHKFFNNKFDRDWENAGDDIPKGIFSKYNYIPKISEGSTFD